MNSSVPGLRWADRTAWACVSLRIALAVFGGYGLSALVAAALAVGLPLPRLEAAMTGIMLGFLVHLSVALWSVAASTVTRAMLGAAIPAALLTLWLAYSIAGARP